MRYYTIQESANILNVSTTTVCELRNYYNFDYIDNDRLFFLKSIVAKIRLKYDNCTLATMNAYFAREGTKYD